MARVPVVTVWIPEPELLDNSKNGGHTDIIILGPLLGGWAGGADRFGGKTDSRGVCVVDTVGGDPGPCAGCIGSTLGTFCDEIWDDIFLTRISGPHPGQASP